MLALICGTGNLPRAVFQARGRALVCAMQGFEPEGLTPDITFRLETLGSLLATLSARGVSEVCFCGAIRRPQVDPSAIDAETVPLVPRLMQAMSLGDDGALRIVLELFEENGMTVLAAHEAAPDLLPNAGILTLARPGPSVALGAVVGESALDQMGAADLGQSCIISGEAIVALEDDAGTDALIRSVSAQTPGAETCFLFKGPKPNQDRRADLPVVGLSTVLAARDSGLEGIVVQAGGVMVLDLAAVVEALNAADMYLWVRPRSNEGV